MVIKLSTLQQKNTYKTNFCFLFSSKACFSSMDRCLASGPIRFAKKPIIIYDNRNNILFLKLLLIKIIRFENRNSKA